MDVKFKTLTAGLAVASALAVGGIANAANNGGTPATNPATPVVATANPTDTATPGDTVDATAADVATAGDTADAADVAGAGDAADVGKADTDTLQQGDQTTPDTAADTAAEAAGSEQPGNDGPGGHADEIPGTPADTTPDTTPAAPAAPAVPAQ
jgi:hypothetical protein